MKKNKNTTPEEEFVGYPKYPADEDIMNRAQRVSLDTESLPHLKPEEPLPIASISDIVGSRANPIGETADNTNPENNEDIPTKENEDEELKDRVYPVDFSGNDLDVPGSELDDQDEKTGNEDEENNSYSLGNFDQ